MAELNVQQQNIVNQLIQAYPELKSYSDEQILSLYNQQLNNIQLSEDELISIMNGRNGISNDGMGLRLEGTQTSVSKEQEAQLKSALTARLNAVSTNVKKAEDSNGFLGSMWSGFKNLTGIGDSSDKVREQQKADLEALESGNIAEAFKQITGLDYTVENVNKFLNNEVQTKSETALNGYTEGQKMALDVGADMISGILAVGALALAPVTGGASILVAAGVGAATKVTIKALAPGEYSMKDLAYDSITGSINGALAPFTNGCGGAVGTGIAKAFGLEALESTAKTALSQAVKHTGKEVVEEVAEETVKQGGKSLLTKILAKQGSEYVLKEGAEKTLKTTIGKVTAYTADMMVDGSLSGAGDGFARALAEGRFEDIPQDMLQGFIGGAIASPFIGGGFRLVGKASSTVLNKINNKITFSSVLPDGTSTKFGQGQVGDCPLLSMIDGFLANERTKGLLINAIQTDVNGNFVVKIGDKTVTVLRSSLTDEMLADKTGIRIFEQAYKQIAGNLDGGFADVVAKHFGLNPLHITSDNITDEVLEKIANDSDNYVLSLGARINADGIVTPDGESQHYFSIKNIDTKTKTVTLVDTYDTSKTLTMSFDDVKTQGISIDGGSVGKTDLPNSVRNTEDVKFRGEETLKNNFDELFDEEAHREQIKRLIDNWTKTSGSEEIVLTINGKDFPMLSFKSRTKNPNDGFNVVNSDIMYRLEPIKNKEDYANMQIANDLYSLLGFKAKNIQLAETSDGLYVMSETFTLKGGFSNNDRELLSKIYGINILLGNDLAFSASCAKIDANKTPIISRPYLDIKKLGTLQSLYLKAPATKDEVIMSLEKVVNLTDDSLIEAIKKHNPENFEQISERLLERKHFIANFLEKVKATEQEGLPLREYLENIFKEVNMEERYLYLQKTTDTSFTDFLQENFDFTIKELLSFQKLIQHPDLTEHLKRKLQKGEINKDELLAFTNRIIGEQSFGDFVKEIPENKIKICDILFDLNQNYNLPFDSSYRIVLKLAQGGKSGNNIDLGAISAVKELNIKYENNLPESLYFSFIKDGKIIPNALSVVETLKEYSFDVKDSCIIVKQLLEQDGSISELKLAKLKEILDTGENSSDATAIFTAINTPDGFNDKLYPYISKLKTLGIDNTDIAEIMSIIRKSFTNVGNGKIIQREHALSIAMKFANEKTDIRTLKIAINELALFDPSIEAQVLRALEKNKNIELTELISFLKSTHPQGQKFDQEAYLLGFYLLREGVPSKDLDKLMQLTRVLNDQYGDKTRSLRDFVENQLLIEKKPATEIVKLLTYVNKKSGLDDFAFDLLKSNVGKLSDEKIINIIYWSTIHSKIGSDVTLDGIQEQRRLIAEYMVDLFNKNYEINDVLKIITGALDKQRSLMSTFVTGVDKEILTFAKKCVNNGCTPDEINQLTANLKINQNILNLSSETLNNKNQMIRTWVENLIFEKDVSPKTVITLLNAIAMKNNMTRALYDYDEKALSLLNKFINEGVLKKDSQENLTTIITSLKLLDYDTNAIDLIKKYLQEPIILENGKKYEIDTESLGIFIGSSKNKETGVFDINKFNENVQLYILQADHGFSLKEMQILAKIYKNEMDISQISTGVKVNLLTKLSYASKDAIKLIEEKVIDITDPQGKKIFGNIDVLMSQLLTDINLASKNIRTSQTQRQDFISRFISNKGRNHLTRLNDIETKISEFDFIQFGKNGLPLKYSRENFIINLREILKDLSPEEQISVLRFHNIDLGENGFNSNPRIKRINQNLQPLSNQGYKDIIFELSTLLKGVDESNLQIYKENNIDTIVQKCIQLTQLDEKQIAEIVKDFPELTAYDIRSLQMQAKDFAELVENNDVRNLPTPLAVKTANEEISTFNQFNEKLKAASIKIEEEYNKFVYENEFITDDIELNNILNGIMRGLPDIMFTVGKQQHKTHAYSVDIHTMEVLKKAINDPDYRTLSDKDRTILKFSILLHDFGKKFINIDTPDTGHEVDSAEIAKGILAQFKLPESVKDRILNIIKNHDWFARYNKGEWDANRVAALFRSPDDYKIAKIMSKADLFSINPEFQYGRNVLNIQENRTIENASQVFEQKLKNLDIAYEKMYAKTNIIMNSKILNPTKIPMDEHYGVRVLNLTDESIPSDMDLGVYGMNGSTKDNLRLTVHMVANENLLGNLESAKLGMESTINDNNVWSISLIKMDRTRTYMYREYGFITDTPISSIAVASPNNLGSGYEKGVDKFVELLFSNTSQRNFLKQKFIQAMHSQGIVINELDYQELSKLIYNKNFLSQLESKATTEINEKTYSTFAIVKAIQESTDALFTGKTHSEIVATNPKIQGLVVRKNSLEDVPSDFIAFAKKYNLPILLVGNK